jgi:hypothetical protein
MPSSTRGGFRSIHQAFAKSVQLYYVAVDRATAAKQTLSSAKAAKAAKRLIAKLNQNAKKAEASAADAWGRVLKQNERWLRYLHSSSSGSSGATAQKLSGRGGRSRMHGGFDSSCDATSSSENASSPFFNGAPSTMVAGPNFPSVGTGASTNPVLTSMFPTPSGIPQGIDSNNINSFGFF